MQRAATRVSRWIAGLGLLLVGVGIGLAQEETPAPPQSTPAADAPVVVAPGEVIVAPAEGLPPLTNFTVVKRIDGNLTGRVSVLAGPGVIDPAQARVLLVHGPQVIAVARTNEEGYFQFVGVAPGVYGVLAGGPAGFAATSIFVRDFDPAAPESAMWLHLCLAPPESLPLLCQFLGEAPFAVPIGAGAVGGGGGGGGGFGGGGAGLLGLGGLAGLAGLAGQEPASPVQPAPNPAP